MARCLLARLKVPDHMSLSKTEYRSDIDGLRAIAVLAVVFFHLDLSFAKGGYVGVDVFFVISGFLITKLIAREFEDTGTFGYANFYLRRVRRLFPALVFTLLVSIIIGIILLIPEHLQRFSVSAIFSIFSISNIYFWLTAGYFDVGSDFKPLLQTWSLSVEEQFYMVWPIALVLMLGAARTRKHLIMIALSALFLASLLLNFAFQDGKVAFIAAFSPEAAKLFADGPSTIFFLLPFRIFEFMIGAALVWLEQYRVRNVFVNEALTISGVVAILFASWAYTSKTLFPSYPALLPCVGTAFIIFSMNNGLMGAVLRSRPMVVIGLISYSLYLIHWPVIIYFKYWKFSPPTNLEKIALLAVSVALATGMYFFVEKPFRHGRLAMLSWPKLRYAAVAFGVACAISSVTFGIWQSVGFPLRYDNVLPIAGVQAETELRNRTMQLCRIENALTPACDLAKPRKILILGDSHAPAWLFALSENAASDTQFTMLSYLYCHGKLVVTSDAVVSDEELGNCKEKSQFLTRNKDVLKQFDAVILASYRPFSYEANPFRFDLINYIRSQNPNMKLFVMGNYYQTRSKEPCSYIMMRMNSRSACVEPRFRAYVGTKDAMSKEPLFGKLRPEDYTFVDIASLVCPTGENCPFSAENVPFMLDSDHLTHHFARAIARQIATDRSDLAKALGLAVKTSPP